MEEDDVFDETGELVCRMGLYLKANNLPADHQHQEDSILGEGFVIRCPYPRCYNGKVCYRHIFFCTKHGCRLCNSMLQLVKVHAGQCTVSKCRVPRCSELKQKKLSKERKLRKREECLKRLQQKERDLKRIYDLQMFESQKRAAATTAAVKDGQGDQSIQNDVNKLLGDLSFMSSTLASLKKEVDREQKQEEE